MNDIILGGDLLLKSSKCSRLCAVVLLLAFMISLCSPVCADAVLYTDTEVGISFPFPNGWAQIPVEDDELVKIQFSSDYGRGFSSISYTIHDVWQGLDLDYMGATREYIDYHYLKEYMVREMLTMFDIEELECKYYGNIKFYLASYHLTYLGYDSKCKAAITMYNGYTLMFQFMSIDHFDEDLPIFESFLSSIQFEETAYDKEVAENVGVPVYNDPSSFGLYKNEKPDVTIELPLGYKVFWKSMINNDYSTFFKETYVVFYAENLELGKNIYLYTANTNSVTNMYIMSDNAIKLYAKRELEPSITNAGKILESYKAYRTDDYLFAISIERFVGDAYPYSINAFTIQDGKTIKFVLESKSELTNEDIQAFFSMLLSVTPDGNRQTFVSETDWFEAT